MVDFLEEKDMREEVEWNCLLGECRFRWRSSLVARAVPSLLKLLLR